MLTPTQATCINQADSKHLTTSDKHHHQTPHNIKLTSSLPEWLTHFNLPFLRYQNYHTLATTELFLCLPNDRKRKWPPNPLPLEHNLQHKSLFTTCQTKDPTAFQDKSPAQDLAAQRVCLCLGAYGYVCVNAYRI